MKPIFFLKISYTFKPIWLPSDNHDNFWSPLNHHMHKYLVTKYGHLVIAIVVVDQWQTKLLHSSIGDQNMKGVKD
jgi:hypothetical protein